MHFTAIAQAFIGVLMVVGGVANAVEVPEEFLKDLLTNSVPSTIPEEAPSHQDVAASLAKRDRPVKFLKIKPVKWIKYCSGPLAPYCGTCYCTDKGKIVWCHQDAMGRISDPKWKRDVCAAEGWGSCKCWKYNDKGLIGF